MNQIVAVAGTLGVFFLLSAHAWAQPRLPHSPTDQELLLLPEECKIFLRGTTEQKILLSKKVPGLAGPNHYCWGLNFINRAKYWSLDREEKRFNLGSAIGEFDYVLKHSAPDAAGLQQVRVQREQAEIMLKTLLTTR